MGSAKGLNLGFQHGLNLVFEYGVMSNILGDLASWGDCDEISSNGV